MARTFYTLDVFTDQALAGNPLAVVTDADGRKLNSPVGIFIGQAGDVALVVHLVSSLTRAFLLVVVTTIMKMMLTGGHQGFGAFGSKASKTVAGGHLAIDLALVETSSIGRT